MKELLKKVEEAVYDGEEELVVETVQAALDAGVDPKSIITDGGVVALNRLGKDFDNYEVFLPELMMAGDCMKTLIDLVNPHLEGGESAYNGKIIIGCAKGDLHDIGKSLVATQLSINGFEVIDLGVDVPTNRFIDKADEVGADIIAVSALLTTSMYYMEELVKRLKSENKRDKYHVVIGGGPVSGDYAKDIGADGYSRTADLAVKMAKRLIEMKPGEEIVIEA